MPRASWAGGVVAAAALSAVGCLSLPKPTAANWFDVFGGSAPPANRIYLQTTLIEQPAGDPYLTDELWSAAAKPVDPERAALLAENGLRVGLIDGNPPPEFLKLVRSEQFTIRPTQSTCPPGEPKVVPVNGPLPRAAFAVAAEIGGPTAAIELTGAECGMAVTPTPADDGRVRLSFAPRVQHGQRQGWLRLTADGTGFAWRNGKAAEAFDELTWTVTIGPKDFILVGPTEKPVGKMGGTFFVTDAAKMRVLVIRAGRGADAPADTPTSRKAVAAQARGQR